MDVVVSIATNILNKLVDEATLQVSYPLRFNKYVKELETEKENLQSKIQEVLDRAKDAKKKTHRVVSQVEKWLNEADFLMAKVVELQEKTKKRNKISCLKHCPNLINRYSLAKQLEEKTNEIKTHNQVQFSEFSRLATLVGMNYFPSQDFEDFDSRKVVYDRLLRALKDDGTHMIGLYGTGGSGKTTLVKEVGREAENFFDKVLFVVVANNYDVRKIQREITDQLSFELKEEENRERAKRLSMRLSCGERLLIILDDVWEELDFVGIGIPIANNQTGCTVVITTRKFHACDRMKCQKIIPLEGLNEDESWALFQKHAGLSPNLSNNLKEMAQNITKVCDGLPIAIEAVAKTLKNIPHDEWDEALKILRNPSWIDIDDEGLKSTYGCFRLSYDNLETEAVKSLFLLCSVYPEDYQIPIGELIIIVLGLGLLGEIPSYRVGAQMINKAIKKLIDSCLLQKVAEQYQYRKGCIKMHDLVRDVAKWIANKENKLITGPLKEDMILEDHAVRHLWFELVDKCPNKLTCPKLEFLHISINSESSVTIPKDFFNGMEKLRVLTLVSPIYTLDLVLQLPISLRLINNLRSLELYQWVLGDISFIGSLERLESLKIWGCSFDELPTCIIQQKQLRLLYLRKCKIQRNPFEVMGRCSQLEVLYFFHNSGKDWEDQINNSAKFFNKISTTRLAMESYCIQFGNGEEDEVFEKDTGDDKSFVARGLYIEDFESCISIETSKDMMRRAKTLSLRRIPESLKNVIPDLCQSIGGGMNELTCLALCDSDGIECVIGQSNPSQGGIISNLTHLTLVKVKHLKTLYSGQPPQGLFANLEQLQIGSCDSLKHILTEDVNEIVAVSDNQSCKNAFPKLKSLDICECKKLEYLMPISFAKSVTKLETLYVAENNELRSMFGSSSEDLNPNKLQIIEFPTLKDLALDSLPNIISICPKNYHPTWSSLKSFSLENCPLLCIKSIIHWVSCGGLRQEDNHMTSKDLLKVTVALVESIEHLTLCNLEVEVVFDVDQLSINGQQVNSKLKRFSFIDLPQLTHIWRGFNKNCLLLQHLDWLKVQSCGNLKQVFPSSILKSLPLLKGLHIEDCKELEEIIEEEDDQNVSNSSSQLVFPNLAFISIKCCRKLKCVFPNISACRVIPNLRALYIENAIALEQVFGHEQHDTTLEYVILWNLPSLTSVAPSIALQTDKYIVVHQCPKLSLTPSITLQELLKQHSKDVLIGHYMFEMGLGNIIKSMDDSNKETMQQINCQETGGQNNDQKLTIIATPNLTENMKESEDRSAHEREMSKEKSVEGRVDECTTSENVQIVTSLAHSELASSTKSVNQIMPALEISAVMPTSSPRPQSISKKSATNPVDISIHQIPSNQAELVNTISTSQSESKYQQQQSLAKNEITKKSIGDLEGQSSQKEDASRENVGDVKGISEGSLSSENAKIIVPSTDTKLATSSIKSVSYIQSQIKFNPDAEDLKDDDLISMLESMEDDYSSKSSILSVPSVATTKDELVAKALAELDDSLRMPLKDIATSDANSLRLQTALNFLSRLSLEDGALSHGVMVVIKSMHKDLPNILSSFKQAFATVNKFTALEERDKSIKGELTQRKEVAIALVSKMSETQKFMDKAQEKEARLKEQISLLEKQRKNCEAELLSLQEQKRKYVAETVEFKKEIEIVRKEKSEMVDDQRNARQELFQVEYKWSILSSQFEQDTTNRNLS